MSDTAVQNLECRLILAELFAEAEAKGLGTFVIGFTATPGHEDEAADYLSARVDFIASARFG